MIEDCTYIIEYDFIRLNFMLSLLTQSVHYSNKINLPSIGGIFMVLMGIVELIISEKINVFIIDSSLNITFGLLCCWCENTLIKPIFIVLMKTFTMIILETFHEYNFI